MSNTNVFTSRKYRDDPSLITRDLFSCTLMLQGNHLWFTAGVTSGLFNSPYKYALRKKQLTGIISSLNKGEHSITGEYVTDMLIP